MSSYVIQILDSHDRFYGVITSRQPMFPENDDDFEEFIISREYLTAHEFPSKTDADRVVKKLHRNPYMNHFSLDVVDISKVVEEQTNRFFRVAV